MPALPGGAAPDGGGARVHAVAARARHGPSWWRASAAAYEELRAKSPFDAVVSEGLAGRALAGRGAPLYVFLGGLEPEHLLNRRLEARGPLGWARWLLLRVPETLLRSWLERRLVRSAERVLVKAPHLGEKAERWYGLPPERVALVPNWFSPDEGPAGPEARARARRELDLEDAGTVFLFASTLGPQKGARTALEAFDLHAERISRSRLLFAGEGEELPELKLRALRLGRVFAVRFLGRLDRAGLARARAAADAFVFPTERIEGMSNALLEAAAAGLACAATDIGGNRHVLGEHALWLRPGDSEGLARAMDLLAGDERLRRRLGEGARARAESEFSEARALARLRALWGDA